VKPRVVAVRVRRAAAVANSMVRCDGGEMGYVALNNLWMRYVWSGLF
jgi:hypothetical protein